MQQLPQSMQQRAAKPAASAVRRRHPVVLMVIHSLDKTASGAFELKSDAEPGLNAILRAQANSPELHVALLQLVALAQFLSQNKASPAAGQAVMKLAMGSIELLRRQGRDGQQNAREVEANARRFAATVPAGGSSAQERPAAAPGTVRAGAAASFDLESLFDRK